MSRLQLKTDCCFFRPANISFIFSFLASGWIFHQNESHTGAKCSILWALKVAVNTPNHTGFLFTPVKKKKIGDSQKTLHSTSTFLLFDILGDEGTTEWSFNSKMARWITQNCQLGTVFRLFSLGRLGASWAYCCHLLFSSGIGFVSGLLLLLLK